ncbi:hypothetical protein Bhyg_09189 [Pseudolycoriella hygida]|uniref:Uncharacterized protein n=1 Tax=Pseudolycoriella hygida TaxID=35572 RepID=A0A9Q0N6S7_9DIPT|nr:hypothetical protein Bhyg_09189 [Pseudolycoriella hygida]
MKFSLKHLSTFLVLASLAIIFQISAVQCEDTGLKNTLTTLSMIISWLPKSSLPAAPLRLISLLLQLLVKQLQTTLTVLDRNRLPSEIGASSSTMTIQKNQTTFASKNWYHPEYQLGRCMIRYAKNAYPEMMDPIASIIGVMIRNGNDWFGSDREGVVSDKKEIRSNEIGYAAGARLRQPVMFVPVPMLPYSRSRPLAMLPGNSPYNVNNYKWKHSPRPLLVKKNINSNKSPDFSSKENNLIESDIKAKNIVRRSRSVNNDHDGQKTNDSANESVINENFKTILLEGLGIDPKYIEKGTPLSCGLNYVIDVFKRAEKVIY